MKRLAFLLAIVTLLGALASCGKEESTATKLAIPSYDAYDLSEYVRIPDYVGFGAVYDDPTVCTEEEIDESIFQVMLSYADFQEQIDGPAEMYNLVNIDVYCYLGGELLEDYSTSGYDLVIGESTNGGMYTQIAEAAIGKTAGETVSVSYTFPDSEYFYGSLANQTVQVLAPINAVHVGKIPECTEEFVQSLTQYDFQTVDDFRAAVRQDILDQKAENRIYAVWAAYSEASEVLKYPEKEIQIYYDDYMAYYVHYAEEYELDLDEFLSEYLNSSVEILEAEAKEHAENSVRSDMIFTQLSRVMGTTLSEEEYQEGLQKYYEKESGTYDTVEEYEADYGKNNIRTSLIWDKSLIRLAELSVRLEKED